MAPSPYAPPRSEIHAAGKVDVSVNAPLPNVCLKCGSTQGIGSRREKLHVMNRRARIALLVLVAVAVAAVIVFDAYTIRGVVFGITVVVAQLVRRAMTKVDLDLPLCPSCNERWSTGMRRRRIYRAIIMGGTVLMFVAAGVVGSPLVSFLFFPIIFGVALANALLRIRSRVVVATGMRGDLVTLSLVHPDAVAAIRASSALPSAAQASPWVAPSAPAS